MATCASCGGTILFGGVTEDGNRYCNKRCLANDGLREIAAAIPEEDLNERVQAIHEGECPQCGGNGPVDIHQSHSVFSLIAFTKWQSSQSLCCRSCATKKQLLASLWSFLFGWWGFPFGLIITPFQIGRNVFAILGGPSASEPSEQLYEIIRRGTAAEVLAHAQQSQPAE